MNTETVFSDRKAQGRRRLFSPIVEAEIASRYWGWGRTDESAEALATLFAPLSATGSVSVNAIRAIANRIRDTKKAPPPDKSEARDPLEADRTNCQADDTAFTTKTEEGI
jgi:hypothetical protein